MNFLKHPAEPEYSPKTTRIEVRQFGIAKVVFVRTKSNGGIL